MRKFCPRRPSMSRGTGTARGASCSLAPRWRRSSASGTTSWSTGSRCAARRAKLSQWASSAASRWTSCCCTWRAHPSAPFGLTMFVGSMGIMEGRRTLDSLQAKFHDVRRARTHRSGLWPRAARQLVDLASAPAVQLWRPPVTVRCAAHSHSFRVPFSASCGVAWTLYLSILNQKDV